MMLQIVLPIEHTVLFENCRDGGVIDRDVSRGGCKFLLQAMGVSCATHHAGIEWRCIVLTLLLWQG